MNILFSLASAEYLRFYDDAIRTLADRGHVVTLAVHRERDARLGRLEDVAAGRENIRVAGLVPSRTDGWRSVAKRLRGLTDFVRYLHPRFAVAPALRARMKRKALHPVFRALDAIPSLGTGGTRAALSLLSACERAVPPSAEVAEFVREHGVDLVVVSPLVEAASEQVELVKAARAEGIPSAVCIASWDNLTNKGLMRVQPDAVLVWNQAQKDEAVELHGANPARVFVTGAQLFDRWFERRPSTSRDTFCRAVGLPDSRPFVLYTCSSSFIAESNTELAFVRRWIAALHATPSLEDLRVVVRPHPYNVHAWQGADLARDGVTVWPREPFNPADAFHRDAFFDSLYHSAAVVGVNTSAMIEAAIVGRPVLTIGTADFAPTQEGTLHFHHLLPENGGFLRVARSLDEHAAQLASVLTDPAASSADIARFIAAFIRPHGAEKPATPMFVDVLERVAATRPLPAGQPGWAPLAWIPIYAVAGYAYAWTLATDGKQRGRLRKRIRGAWERSRKRAAKRTRETSRRIRAVAPAVPRERGR